MHKSLSSSHQPLNRSTRPKTDTAPAEPVPLPEAETDQWTPARILRLQGIVGNRAVQRMMRRDPRHIQRLIYAKLDTDQENSSVEKLEHLAPIYGLKVDAMMQQLKTVLLQNLVFPDTYKAACDKNVALLKELQSIVDYVMKASTSTTVITAAKGDAATVATQLEAIIRPELTLTRLNRFAQFRIIKALGDKSEQYTAFLNMVATKNTAYESEGGRLGDSEEGEVSRNRQKQLKTEAMSLMTEVDNANKTGDDEQVKAALKKVEQYMQKYPETEHVWDLDYLEEYRNLENKVETDLAQNVALGDKFKKDGGTTDNVNLKETYNSNLACTLFSILAVKPGWLGAEHPEDLHRILRRTKELKEYDDDRVAAKIRYLAGLEPHNIAADNKNLGKFLQEQKKAKTHPPFIVDALGIAHTFAAVWKSNDYQKVDEATPRGGSFDEYLGNKMLVYWTNPG